jgi:hypothetical protein
MRRRCADLVASLDVPRRSDSAFLCRQVGELRGRPIQRLSMSLPAGGPSGLWAATHDVDYIVFEERAGPLHQEHIVLHELGHILWDHEATLVEAGHFPMLTQLDPVVVRQVLGRNRYSAAEEQQAELVASLILERMTDRSAQDVWEAPPETAGVVHRLERSFLPLSVLGP